jgi:hypothetical protein
MALEYDAERTERELNALYADAPAALKPMVDVLLQAARARHPTLTPAVGAAIVTMLRDQVRAGATAEEVVQAARDRTLRFDNPGWAPGVVNQAQKVIYNLHLPATTAPGGDRTPPRPLPVVLLVMTDHDARQLVDRDAFTGEFQSLEDDFERLRVHLQDSQASDWQERYGPERTDWRPFGAGGSTIGELVRLAVGDANRHLKFAPALEADFHDIMRINDDRWELQRLRHDGCLVIMDSIAMRHPLLQRAFHRSLLDAYPRTAVVAIAPIQTALEKSHDLTVALRVRLADLEFARRRDDPYGGMDCIETSRQPEFDKWLVAGIQNLAPCLGVKAGIRRFGWGQENGAPS